MWAAGILCHVAANRASVLAGGIRSKVEAMRSESVAEIEIHNSRLHSGAEVGNVDFQDAVHARKGKNDATASRNRSAAEAGTCPSGNNGNALARRELYDFRYVLRGLRKDNILWRPARE